MCPVTTSIGSGTTGCMVNVQWMVEETFERRMDQDESHIRQQMDEEGMLLEGSSSDSDSDELDHLSN